MAESIQTGLSLLLIGMLTVFTVLSIVVLTGRVLIYSLNKVKAEPVTQSPRSRTESDKEVLSSRKLAAITIATQLMTDGTAHIATVQRIES